MWKGVIKCAGKLNANFRWKIGDGGSISFMVDTRFKDKKLVEVIERINELDYVVKLSQVLNEDGEWDFSALRTVLPHDIKTELENSGI